MDGQTDKQKGKKEQGKLIWEREDRRIQKREQQPKHQNQQINK